MDLVFKNYFVWKKLTVLTLYSVCVCVCVWVCNCVCMCCVCLLSVCACVSMCVVYTCIRGYVHIFALTIPLLTTVQRDGYNEWTSTGGLQLGIWQQWMWWRGDIQIIWVDHGQWLYTHWGYLWTVFATGKWMGLSIDYVINLYNLLLWNHSTKCRRDHVMHHMT